MASITSSTPLSVRRSQISSMYLSSNRLSPNLVLLKSRSTISGASALAFSPLQKNNKFPCRIEFGSKSSNFDGWSQVLRQRSVEFPLPEAAASADANGREFEISDGFETYYSCLSNLWSIVSRFSQTYFYCRNVKSSKGFAERFPVLITGLFFFLWYDVAPPYIYCYEF